MELIKHVRVTGRDEDLAAEIDAAGEQRSAAAHNQMKDVFHPGMRCHGVEIDGLARSIALLYHSAAANEFGMTEMCIHRIEDSVAVGSVYHRVKASGEMNRFTAPV